MSKTLNYELLYKHDIDNINSTPRRFVFDFTNPKSNQIRLDLSIFHTGMSGTSFLERQTTMTLGKTEMLSLAATIKAYAEQI